MRRIAEHKRKIWKAMEHTIGMRIPLFLAFLILTLVPLLVQVRFTSGYFYQSHVEERMAEAQNRCLILANKIRSSDYINVLLSGNPNPALDAELSTTADLMNGRIVLVDDSFKILKDTFGLSRGKTLVVSDVLKAFHGETSSYLNQKKKYFYVAQPIQAKSTDAAPIDSDVAAGNGKNTAGVQGVLLLMASTENSALLQEKIVQKTGFLQLVMFCFILIADLLAAACLLKPFRRLQQQLDMVAEGNLDQDIDVKTYRETRDISEAVMQTIRKLKNLDQSRQEFVSNVSHELKTPLTSIRVLADSLMGMENAPAELYQEFMQDISAEIDREGKIIDDLLTLVKMDKSSPDLNIAQTSINGLLEQILKRLTPIAKRRNIEITYESKREVSADVDEVKLSLALSNLVENAIKYNREEGKVWVTLDADHKFFYVKVEDNGVGIPKEFQERVFERFYRVDKARSRETGGTGLGLAITKNIILLHQGAIRLKSEEGKGATFTVRIPLNYIP